jgi:hypothetical protein
MMSSVLATTHAQSWIAAWNAHDIDAILSHYADDIEFQADTVVSRWQRADGVLRGKRELREHSSEVSSLLRSSSLSWRRSLPALVAMPCCISVRTAIASSMSSSWTIRDTPNMCAPSTRGRSASRLVAPDQRATSTVGVCPMPANDAQPRLAASALRLLAGLAMPRQVAPASKASIAPQRPLNVPWWAASNRPLEPTASVHGE